MRAQSEKLGFGEEASANQSQPSGSKGCGRGGIEGINQGVQLADRDPAAEGADLGSG